MTGLHIYRCENPKRVRRMCPFHKHQCYGEIQEFYDTARIFFDCGTYADYGYGYYEPPKKYKSITIFKDEDGYTAWVPRAGFEMLVRNVALNKALAIAKARLKKGGQLKGVQ